MLGERPDGQGSCIKYDCQVRRERDTDRNCKIVVKCWVLDFGELCCDVDAASFDAKVMQQGSLSGAAT